MKHSVENFKKEVQEVSKHLRRTFDKTYSNKTKYGWRIKFHDFSTHTDAHVLYDRLKRIADMSGLVHRYDLKIIQEMAFNDDQMYERTSITIMYQDLSTGEK